MREQDAGAACIPVAVLREALRQHAFLHADALCRCGADLLTGDVADDRTFWARWSDHFLTALAPAAGTARALPAAVVALLRECAESLTWEATWREASPQADHQARSRAYRHRVARIDALLVSSGTEGDTDAKV